MPICIYNSLTRKKEEFIPLKTPQVNIYTCGVTVYDESHIGHARSLFIFDLIRRYLEYRGYKVKFVRNITDIDDKIINRAKELKIDWQELVKKYVQRYYEDLEALGLQKGDYEPRATENIVDMIKHIEGLIKKGFAYVTESGVYFNVRKFKDYGKLSGQGIDQMLSGSRIEPDETKRDPLDFALWKISKPDEPSWPSPWKPGRPGWHIECSVMSQKFLKTDTLDIHAGGRDLIFPHHENEIAQSEALTGKPFAKYWIHHGLLTINGQKMAKSLGNFITIKDFLNRYSNVDFLKLFFLSAHYSHPIDYTDGKIQEAREALERIVIFLHKIDKDVRLLSHEHKKIKEIEDIRCRFEEAMDDDFNTPRALACMFELVNMANKNLDNPDFIFEAKNTLNKLRNILNFKVGLEEVKGSGIESIGLEINKNINEREMARKERDYLRADEIRKAEEKKGIILEDKKNDKTIWRIQWEKFAENIEEKLKLEPKRIDLRLQLSVIYGEYIGKKQQAIELCEEILKQDANNVSAKFNLAVYTSHIKPSNISLPIYKDAEELIGKQGLINTELYGKLNIFIGTDYKNMGDKVEAKRRYEMAIKILGTFANQGDKTSAFWLEDAKNNLKKLLEEENKT